MREGKRLIALHEFDVMLVDLNLGDGTGFQLIEYMKSMRPVAEAVVVSAMEDEEHALHAFALGFALSEGYIGVQVSNGVEVQMQRSAVVQVLPKGTIK